MTLLSNYWLGATDSVGAPITNIYQKIGCILRTKTIFSLLRQPKKTTVRGITFVGTRATIVEATSHFFSARTFLNLGAWKNPLPTKIDSEKNKSATYLPAMKNAMAR